jgi:hypothetical protein
VALALKEIQVIQNVVISAENVHCN